MTRRFLVGLAAAASCAAWSPRASAHVGGSSLCGERGCVPPVPTGLVFRARLGTTYVYDDLRTDTEHYSFHGFGPAGTLLLGLPLSAHFTLDLEAPLRAAPAGTLTRDGLELTGNSAVWSLTPNVGLTIFTLSGWHFRPAIGGARAATSFPNSLDLRDRRWGGAASLAVGWDTLVSGFWATGAALSVNYSHIPSKLEGSGADITQNLLALSFELSLGSY